MKIQLCKTNLMRLGSEATQKLLAACAAASATVERRDCLVRCAQCERGCIATVDGMPVGAATADELAGQIAGFVP